MIQSPCSPGQLWCEFVESVERVVHRYAAHVGKTSLGRQLAQLGLVQAKRAESLAVAGQRQRQAQQHTAALEKRADRPLVLLRLVGAVDLEAKVGTVWLQRLVDRPQDAPRVDRIMDDVEGGHQVVPAREAL